MKFESVEKFAEQAESILAERNKFKRRLFVCAGSACVAGGALELFEQLAAEVKQKNLPVTVELRNEHYWQAQDGKQMLSLGGCQGLCQMGPVVYVYPDDIFYCKVRPKDAAELLEHTVLQEKPLERLLYKDPKSSKQLRGKKDIPFFKSQKFVALDKCGIVDPYSLEDYIAVGGYRALVKALSQMSPDEIVDTVDKSGLRGRGGGGFPTGRKWKSCLKAGGDTRYVICNGDEGDPGAFMDCSIMEGLPFKVIEGMTIGGYALRSSQGFIYVRHEYPRAVERLQNAIERAREAGLLGENILGSGFSFDIKISRGGGAFVCGESSALMQSLEGRVGEPRPKYIHSTERGLYDKPTVLNNVETWACVPEIVNNGADWFASMGTEKSKGTKAFSLVGKVNNTGLIEVPMGMTLRQIIFDIGGGIIGGKKFKAVQTGGPSGGCLPESKLDLPVDFDTLTEAGSMMGSGGMIVMDERNCMVDVARYFINFLMMESCGKCVPCREGLVQLKDILDRICDGKGQAGDIDTLKRLAKTLEAACLCALGRTAANPVLSTLQYFEAEYKEHIDNHRCPGGVCKALITYSVNDNCTGCMLCAKNCPVNAITGEKKKKHVIDASVCTRCGACEAVCQYDAITVE